MIVSVKFYVIMRNGMYYTKKGFWTCNLLKAKIFDKISQARAKVTILSQTKNMEIPVLMELEATSLKSFQVEEEKERVLKSLEKKKKKQELREIRYKEYQ